jgi:WD40 repeat protein
MSPDGKFVASGDSNGRVRLWEASSGRLLTTWANHIGRVRALSFCADSSVLASGGVDGAIYLRDPYTRETRLLAEGAGGWTSQGLALSPDGSLLGAGFPGNVFRVLRVEDGSVAAEFPTGDAQALSLRFTPDGGRVAVIPRGVAVEIWDLAGEHLASLSSPHGSAPWTMDFSADGAKLATGLWSGNIVVFDVASRRVDQILEGHQGTVWSVAFVPGDEDLLASSAADGTIKLWSLSLGRNVATLQAYEGDALTVSVGPAGRRLVAAGAGADVLVWDLAHFERHMAGNLQYQMGQFTPELGGEIPKQQLLDWAAEVLAR